MAPPSMLLLVPVAIGYVVQTVRFANLSLWANQSVGTRALNLWTYLFFAPIVFAALNPATFLQIEYPILWTRMHFLALMISMLILGEVLLRTATLRAIADLALIVEQEDDTEKIKKASDALELLDVHDLAVVGLTRIVSIDPGDSKSYSHIAALYGIQRRFEASEAAARRAIALDPRNSFGHYCLGMALGELAAR